MSRCLSCGRELLTGEEKLHLQCARKLFKLPLMPACSLASVDLQRAAEEHNLSRVPVEIIADANDDTPHFIFAEKGSNYTLSVSKSLNSQQVFIEDLVMRLATAARIKVAPRTLVECSDGHYSHLVDSSIRVSGRKNRVRVEELSDMLPNRGVGLDCEELAEWIMRHTTSPKLECINLFERLYFAWLVGDATYGVDRLRLTTSQDGFASLAPATLFSSAVLCGESSDAEVAIAINGKCQNISTLDFVESMMKCGISEKVAENIVAKFANMVDPWCDMIEESLLSEKLREQFKFMFFLKL